MNDIEAMLSEFTLPNIRKDRRYFHLIFRLYLVTSFTKIVSKLEKRMDDFNLKMFAQYFWSPEW